MPETDKSLVAHGEALFKKLKAEVKLVDRLNSDLSLARKHVCCNRGGEIHAAVCECCGGRCYLERLVRERGHRLYDWPTANLCGADVTGLVAYVEAALNAKTEGTRT